MNFHLFVEKVLGPCHDRAGDDPGALFGAQQVERFQELAEAVVDGAGGSADGAVEEFEGHIQYAAWGSDITTRIP
jgi:hypothetical protein